MHQNPATTHRIRMHLQYGHIVHSQLGCIQPVATHQSPLSRPEHQCIPFAHIRRVHPPPSQRHAFIFPFLQVSRPRPLGETFTRLDPERMTRSDRQHRLAHTHLDHLPNVVPTVLDGHLGESPTPRREVVAPHALARQHLLNRPQAALRRYQCPSREAPHEQFCAQRCPAQATEQAPDTRVPTQRLEQARPGHHPCQLARPNLHSRAQRLPHTRVRRLQPEPLGHPPEQATNKLPNLHSTMATQCQPCQASTCLTECRPRRQGPKPCPHCPREQNGSQTPT